MNVTNLNIAERPEVLSECTPISSLVEFHRIYGTIHVYLMLFWCPLGVLSNLLNIVVLNQRRMRTSTNFLLTCLAISDACLMFLYVIFVSYFVIGGRMRSLPYPMAVYLLVHVNLQNILHIFSCGIIITLAVFRLLYARCLLKCQQLCSQRRAELAVLIVLLTACFFTIPCMISHHVESANSDLGPGDLELSSVQHMNLTQMYTVNYVDNMMLRVLVYWTTAVFVKLLPLTSMITLSSLLVVSIHQRARAQRRTAEQRKTSGKLGGGEDGIAEETRTLASVKLDNEWSEAVANPLERVIMADRLRERSHSRTTHMLLAIMMIYIVTYLPQAILLLVSGLSGYCFSETVYDPLGDFMDLLTLLSCGINFALYCLMSQQFRTTFLQLFCPAKFRHGKTRPHIRFGRAINPGSHSETLEATEDSRTVR
ncbi:putative G-protein coupled receptor [Echinococcus granulosus]|uniref:G-protein coupled receptor n=1 Tax=Echinococcus granulosus TaxID=6210 RepID=W6USP6_ECHGR|nr:putative G-protein coupled receptor [Echinococcus granulosus]EUB64635.1 putative G-protein coupled receptor [Echinococcus granulosus]